MRNKREDFTAVELIVVGLILLGLVSWIWNATKFASCDFEPNYRCEAIHAIGLFVPPTAMVTVWFDDDGVDE